MMPMIPGAAAQRPDVPSGPAGMANDRLAADESGLARKVDVNYRKAEGAGTRCSACQSWDGGGGCAKVAGTIAPDATCDLFEQAQPEKMPGMPGEPPQGATSAFPPQ